MFLVTNSVIINKSMLKSGLKSVLLLLTVFIAFTCIDPYIPKLTGYKPVMVVEGLITNAGSSYSVRLSQSVQQMDSVPVKISDATVYVIDDNGTRADFTYRGNGVYGSDSLTFRGETGRSYQLHIKTSGGSEYVSDTCKMLPVPGIDTLYYGKDSRLTQNQTVTRLGLAVYLDSKPGASDKYFLRWDFKEIWKFKVPLPTKFAFLNDSTINPLPASEVREFCWKNSGSSEILTGTVHSGGNARIEKKTVNFIAPELSDRISLRYSILVNQYSVSQKEYDYWNNLKEVSETEGDIFGSQPFAVMGNIRNADDPTEQVLGYFSVSSVDSKRLYINYLDIVPLGLPNFHYPCKRTVVGPSDYHSNPWSDPMTFSDIYYMYMGTPGWAFVEPVYDEKTNLLTKLVFSATECASCTVTGTDSKPDFWIDN
jgi:hypothetical protein